MTICENEEIRENGQDDGDAPNGYNGLVAITYTKRTKFAICPVRKPGFEIMKHGEDENKQNDGSSRLVSAHVIQHDCLAYVSK